MFAQLGEIKFELNPSLTSLTETTSYNYAQHERINNKPLLQFLGQNLQQFNISLKLHSSFCNPEEEIRKLKNSTNQATTLKYIKGNGEYVGVFTINEIQQTTEQTSAEGDLMSVQLELSLSEFVGKITESSPQVEKGFKQKAN